MRERIRVINLDRRDDRLKQVTETFAQQKLSFQRVPAFDFRFLDQTKWNYKISQAELACLLSHKKVWDSCSDYIFVCEDDIGLCKSFPRSLDKLLKKLPKDCELFYAGIWSRGDHEQVDDGLYKVNFGLGTHSYIIARSVIDRVLPMMDGHHGQVDLILAQEVEAGRCKAYAAIPCLAYQTESYSDLKDVVAIEWRTESYPPWIG